MGGSLLLPLPVPVCVPSLAMPLSVKLRNKILKKEKEHIWLALWGSSEDAQSLPYYLVPPFGLAAVSGPPSRAGVEGMVRLSLPQYLSLVRTHLGMASPGVEIRDCGAPSGGKRGGVSWASGQGLELMWGEACGNLDPPRPRHSPLSAQHFLGSDLRPLLCAVVDWLWVTLGKVSGLHWAQQLLPSLCWGLVGCL